MATDHDRSSRIRWGIFALACGTSFLLYLHRYTWAFVKADVAREFGWKEGTLGMLDGAFMLSYAMGQVPGGMLADWYGPRRVLSGMILLWSFGLGAATMVSSLPGMILARLFFGIGQAGCYPTLNKITKSWFPLSGRTAIQGWIASFSGRLGGAASNVIFATILIGMCGFSWRMASVLFMILGLLATALFWSFFRNSPRQHWLCNQAECTLIEEDDPESHIVQGTRLDWNIALRSFNLWMLSFQQFTCAFADNIFSSWIPLFLLNQKGVDLKSAGWMAALPLLGGAVGGMFGGTLQNTLILRTGNRKWSRRGIGLIGNLLSGAFMFVSLGFTEPEAIIAVFFVLKFFADWAQPTLWGTATDIAGKNSASVFAIVNTAGSLAGVVAGPIMGKIVEFFSGGQAQSPTGWFVLFFVLGLVYLASALSWLFIDCTRPLDRDLQPATL